VANSLQGIETAIQVKSEIEDIQPQKRQIESVSYQFSNSTDSVTQFIKYEDGGLCVRVQELVRKCDQKEPHSAFWYSYLRTRKVPKTSSNVEQIKLADLYSGIGGLSLGVREACISLGLGFQSKLAVENDPVTLDVYDHNFECDNPIQSDITEVMEGDLGAPPTENEIHFMDKIGKINIVVAGPPCQGFSNLNNHTRRDDVRNDLYLRAARFVELFEPDHLIIENVSQVKLDKKGVTKKTIELLDTMGYSHDEAAIDLSTVGVPQKRKRHVIVASKKKDIRITEAMNKYQIAKPRSVMWGIDDLQETMGNLLINTPANLSETNNRRVHYLHSNDEYKLPMELRPKCHQNNEHSYWSMYGRMYPDIPAQTITGGFYSPGQGRFIHPTKERTVTAHEAARLQFFPDFFKFSKVTTKKAIAKMIGNAAPMLLSYYLSLELLS